MTSKGTLYGYVILKESGEIRNKENLFKEINQYISDRRPIAKLDKIQFVSVYPKHVLVKLCVEYLEKCRR
jgi:acetyl-CoA synthetase